MTIYVAILENVGTDRTKVIGVYSKEWIAQKAAEATQKLWGVNAWNCVIDIFDLDEAPE